MATLLEALIANESGGRNIPNVHQGTSSGQAQGYFQITTGTWRDFGGLQYAPTPLEATPEQQAAVAARIPLKRWDESTIARMRATGRRLDPNLTLGENLSMNNESFTGYARDAEGGGGAPATGRYDPRRDTPSYARPTGEKVADYAGDHPPGPQGDVVTNSPYTLPPAGTADNPLITKEKEKNPFEKVGAAVAKLGDRDNSSTLGGIPNIPNAPSPVLPAMPGIDLAAADNQRKALAAALMRLNTGQLWPTPGGGIG